MVAFVAWLFLAIFLFWDCVFFARFHEGAETPGWIGWVMALVPGSGWYYKYLTEQKEKS